MQRLPTSLGLARIGTIGQKQPLGVEAEFAPKEPLAAAGFQTPQIPPTAPTCAIWIRLTTLSSERRSARRSGKKGIVDSWRLEQCRGFDIGRKSHSRNSSCGIPSTRWP